jgi:hypothetical protein
LAYWWWWASRPDLNCACRIRLVAEKEREMGRFEALLDAVRTRTQSIAFMNERFLARHSSRWNDQLPTDRNLSER